MGETPWRFKSSHPHRQIRRIRGPDVAQTSKRVNEAGKDIVVTAPPATATFSAGAPKITVTMPLEIMVRGFVLAVRRYEAAVAGDNAVDVYIALFEAFAWFDSLDERSKLANTDEGRAMRFVRQRTHHQWAAAAHPAIGGWRWFKLEILPSADPRHPSPAGERLYRKVLEQRPVIDALRRVEVAVRKLAPNAELTWSCRSGRPSPPRGSPGLYERVQTHTATLLRCRLRLGAGVASDSPQEFPQDEIFDALPPAFTQRVNPPRAVLDKETAHR